VGLVLDLVSHLKHRVLLALLLPYFLFQSGYLGFNLSLIAILIMSLVGIYICGQTAKVIDVHDDGRIVWDEFAGQSITLLPLIFFNIMSLQWALIGFCLFRLFDVWKPWPIRVADQKLLVVSGLCLMTSLQGFGLHLYYHIYYFLGVTPFK
jgi:phosphatidylglycerophosphatase A